LAGFETKVKSACLQRAKENTPHAGSRERRIDDIFVVAWGGRLLNGEDTKIAHAKADGKLISRGLIYPRYFFASSP
jgi:hypothetical protein